MIVHHIKQHLCICCLKSACQGKINFMLPAHDLIGRRQNRQKFLMQIGPLEKKLKHIKTFLKTDTVKFRK